MKFVDLKRNDIKTEKYNFGYYNECPVCASRNIKDKYKLKDYYIISKCLNCSALFVKEILTEDFLKNFYQKSSEADFIYEDNNQIFLDYYYHKIKSEIEKIKPTKGAILDVVNIGSFEDYPVKKNYFDVITLQDVFDHFINPYKNLKKCCDMLKPSGFLVIKVHNISCLYAKIKGANFYAIIPPVHLFYFNEKSLKYILNRVGFKFFKSKFIAHKLQLKTVFYILSRDGRNSFYYKLCNLLKNSIFGNITIYKNFHDIITVFAIKDEIKEKA